MGIHIRVAKRDDAPALLELTRACPMEGRIPLLINREPNFFNLVDLRGENSVWIAEENNRLAGSVSVYFQHTVYEKQRVRIAQICDLKIEPSFRKTTLAYKLLKTLQDFLLEMKIDWMTALISEGNKFSELLTIGKTRFPKFQKVAAFNVRELVPRKYKGDEEVQTSVRGYTSTVCRTSLPINELFDLLQQQKNNYLLFPDISRDEFISESEKSKLKFYWTNDKNGNPSSFIAVMDTQNLKQNSVMSLPFSLRLGSGIQRTAASVFGTSPLPKIGEPIRMAYVKYWSVYSETEFQRLIKAALADAFQNKLHFLSVGLDVNDPYSRMTSTFRGFDFKTNLYLASINGLPIPSTAGKYFQDFSLV